MRGSGCICQVRVRAVKDTIGFSCSCIRDTYIGTLHAQQHSKCVSVKSTLASCMLNSTSSMCQSYLNWCAAYTATLQACICETYIGILHTQ